MAHASGGEGRAEDVASDQAKPGRGPEPCRRPASSMHPCELENSALAEGLVGTREEGTRRKARSVFNEREKL